MDLHRLGIKFFAADPAAVRLEDFIPIFHGWIQKQSLAGHLLIDIHDYSHIHHGPGILLVAREGNFSIDMSDGRPGLLYYRKTPSGLSPAEHVTAIFSSALQACLLLEKDAGLQENARLYAETLQERDQTIEDRNQLIKDITHLRFWRILPRIMRRVGRR